MRRRLLQLLPVILSVLPSVLVGAGFLRTVASATAPTELHQLGADTRHAALGQDDVAQRAQASPSPKWATHGGFSTTDVLALLALVGAAAALLAGWLVSARGARRPRPWLTSVRSARAPPALLPG